MSVFVSLKGDLLISYFIVTLNEISASTVKPTVIFLSCIILKLLEYLFTENTISVFLLHNFTFNSVCYLPLLSN